MLFVCETCKKEYKTTRGLSKHSNVHKKQQELHEIVDFDTEKEEDSKSDSYYDTDNNSSKIIRTNKEDDENDNDSILSENDNDENDNDEIIRTDKEDNDNNSDDDDNNDNNSILSENDEVELVKETVNLYRICDVKNVFLKIDQFDGNRKKLKKQLETKINLFNKKFIQHLDLINKNKNLSENKSDNLRKDLAQLKVTIETEIKTGLVDQKEMFTENLNELSNKIDESLNTLNDQIEQNKETIEIINDQVDSNNNEVNNKINNILEEQKNNFNKLNTNTSEQFSNIKNDLIESFKKTNQDIYKLKDNIDEFNSQNLKLSKLINLSIDQQTKNEIKLHKINEKIENISDKIDTETISNKNNFELINHEINNIDLFAIETNIINQIKKMFEPLIEQQNKHDNMLLKLIETNNNNNNNNIKHEEIVTVLTIEEKVKALMQHLYNSSNKDKDLKRYVFKLTHNNKSFIGNGKFKLPKNIYKKYDDVINLIERTGLTSNDFEFEVINECLCKSNEEANLLTDMYIDYYNTLDNGYNLNYYNKKYKKIKSLNVTSQEELLESI